MMIKTLLKLIVLFFIITPSFSQKLSDTYGAVVPADINYVHKEDPSAAAVVLFDKGESIFVRNVNGGFDILFERKRRIKVLSKGGTGFANVEILQRKNDNNRESISEINGTTYNFIDGKLERTALDVRDVFKEEYNEFYDVSKFAMPNVKTGSIIEYSYKITSPFKYFFRSWAFQSNIPTLSSSYVAKMIPFYEYSFILQEIEKLDHEDAYVSTGFERQYSNITYKDMVYEFGMKNIPAFDRDEKFITSEDDYLKKIYFQLSKTTDTRGVSIEYSTTWKKLVDETLKQSNFGGYINASERKGKKIIEEQLIGLTQEDDIQKYNKIIDYIKSSLTWSQYYTKYASQTAGETLKSKTGHSADINLFAVGILRAAGLEAHPLFISTRNNGRIFYSYPFESFFNNTIGLVKLNGNDFFFDATKQSISNYLLPANCLNESGLLIDKENPSWYPMKSMYTSITDKQIFMQKKPGSDSLGISIKTVYTHYDAIAAKARYGNTPELLKKLPKEHGYNVKGVVKNTNYEEKEKLYQIKYQASIPMESFKDKIIIAPFLSEVIDQNHLKKESREYPVDFAYKKKRKYTSTILIPDGYKVIQVPEAINIEHKLASVSYKTTLLTGSLRVSGEYQFKKSKYPPEEYEELREIYKTIFSKFNEEVVLQKISKE